MRIRDLYEDNHTDELYPEIMNIVMMFIKSGMYKTKVENIINELSKQGFIATSEDIENFVDQHKLYSIDDDNLIHFTDMDVTDADERPDLETEDEYDPAVEKAREATRKRMK